MRPTISRKIPFSPPGCTRAISSQTRDWYWICSYDLCHSCGNDGFLTHSTGLGIESELPERQRWIINLLHHSKSSRKILNFDPSFPALTQNEWKRFGSFQKQLFCLLCPTALPVNATSRSLKEHLSNSNILQSQCVKSTISKCNYIIHMRTKSSEKNILKCQKN